MIIRQLEHPEEIIGENIDTKTGKPSPRFPVLKYVYEYGRNI